MELDAPIIVSGAFKTAVWAFLLVQGFRLRFIWHYPLAYFLFACEFASFWIRTAALVKLGPADPHYYWIYYGTLIPVELLALLNLLRIYYLHHPPSLRKDWPLLAVVPVFIALSMTEPRSLGYRTAYVLFACLATTGFLTATRNLFSRRLKIGDNLYWLTYGITVPAALQAFNQVLNYLGAAVWSYDAFRVANELTTAISWCMIAYGMRRYDPPRIAEAEEGTDPAVERLKELTRTLWRMR